MIFTDRIFVKTLPHLIPLHCAQLGIGLYADIHNLAIENYISTSKALLPESITFSSLQQTLVRNNYQRKQFDLSAGTYSIQGDILRVWPLGSNDPVRLEFFDQEVENMFTYDPDTGRKLVAISQLWVGDIGHLPLEDYKFLHISDYSYSKLAIFSVSTPKNLAIREVYPFDYTYPPLFWNRVDLLQQEVVRMEKDGYKIEIVSRHWDQLPQEFSEKRLTSDTDHYQILTSLPAGFQSAKEKYVLLTDREIFGTIHLSSKIDLSAGNTDRLLRQLEGEISIGDYIVHREYGVGIYAGLTQEEVDEQMLDYLEIQYADTDQLLVPINQLDKLTKYIGTPGIAPKITTLSKKTWEKSKQKVQRSIKLLARELVEHYARREMSKAGTIMEDDTSDYLRFVSGFEYEETPDQIRTVNEVLHDMQSETPMNRLIVGDVGFGKTEVMLRAAYKAAEAGLQVAILCPTTVLAAQHHAVFKKRFSGTDYSVESVSRFNTPKENRQIADKINKGEIQVLVGTHRLLSNDIKFKKLGLLIVDEEQRFGVRQKEKIKRINYGIHFLAASATPIPRTLSMALATIQDISIINTPPTGRKPIQTSMHEIDWDIVARSVLTELNRGGQVYFVHNTVQELPSILHKLQTVLPDVRIAVGHGQLSNKDLDRVINDFYQHKFDVLLSTTIIENGIDIPNVNTIIINNSQRMGLSQLYQLRGRVGRSERQAYCYLFYRKQGGTDGAKKVKKVQQQRIDAIVDSTDLGSGFRIASQDLEIRGAGSLLGEQQHGHISNIGYALYMQLLSQEIERLKNINSIDGIVSF